MHKFLIILLTLLKLSVSFATHNRAASWFGTFAQKDITDNFLIWAETQFRYNLELGKNQQILYRPGILHKINEHHQLGYLFAYIQSDSLKEHRFALQHIQKYGNFFNADFSARSRLEARFIEDNSDDAARFRYLLRAEGSCWVTWEEIFLNLTDDNWTGNRVVDRNRFFLGLKHFVSDIRVEYGYLNQYIPRATNDVMEHIFTVYLFF